MNYNTNKKSINANIITSTSCISTNSFYNDWIDDDIDYKTKKFNLKKSLENLRNNYFNMNKFIHTRNSNILQT